MNRVPNTEETVWENPLSLGQPRSLRRMKRKPLLEKETAVKAFKQAFLMLRPDTQWKNPVMFVVEVGAFLTLLYILEAAWGGATSEVPISYFIWVDAWLFLTVLVRQLCDCPCRSSRQSPGGIAEKNSSRYSGPSFECDGSY